MASKVKAPTESKPCINPAIGDQRLMASKVKARRKLETVSSKRPVTKIQAPPEKYN